jgi:hypothetical protein
MPGCGLRLRNAFKKEWHLVERSEPNWQPISQLPLLTSMVDTVLENTEDQYQTFVSIKERPHVLDDDIVNRAIRLYQAQIDDVWFYEEQFSRWLAEPLTDRPAGTVSPITRLTLAAL